MMTSSVEESQLQRIIRDLRDAVTELNREYQENGEPITDDCTNLHKLCFKLEYLLQFYKKEKSTFLGNRKDYWDYFCDCLAKVKGANDGIRFVKSIPELKTSLGKGRAFLRYSLVHQRLADTLQQCLMNRNVTSDWYYARSPFLNPHMSSELINSLYELNDVQFDIASRGHDLDAAWPSFARRTLASANSPGHLWKPPSRSSSMSSLVSSYLQAQEFPSSPDANSSLVTEQLEAVDELRVELDQSELKQREMQERIQQLQEENKRLQQAVGPHAVQTEGENGKNANIIEENIRLTKVIPELQKQCEISSSTQTSIPELQKCLNTLELNAAKKQHEYQVAVMQLEMSNKENALKLQSLTHELEALKVAQKTKDLSIAELQEKLHSTEQKKLELTAKIDAILNEKGQQTVNHYDSALKIHELLDKLNEAEKEKIEMQKTISELESRLKTVSQELERRAVTATEFESKWNAFTLSSEEENSRLVKKIEELESLMNKLQGALTVKEKEAANLQMQLQDTFRYVETLEKQWEEKVEKERKEKEELQKKCENIEETLEERITSLSEKLKHQEMQLSTVSNNARLLEDQKSRLVSEKEGLMKRINELEKETNRQGLILEETTAELEKLQLANEKLKHAVITLEEKNKELVQSSACLESEVTSLRASEKQLQSQINDATFTVDEKERKLREENQHLDESLQNATRQNKTLEEELRKLQADHADLRQSEMNVNSALSLLQGEHRNTKQQVLELEKDLSALKENENCLRSQITEQQNVLSEKENLCKQLLEMLEKAEEHAKISEKEKLNLEKTFVQQTKVMESLSTEKASVERMQLEQKACQEKEAQELSSRLALTQQQLEVHAGELSRLQAEVLDLRTKLQQVSEEKGKVSARLDLTEKSLEEYKTLVQQLKEHTESLNRDHVQELLQLKEREERLQKEKEDEASKKAELETSLQALQEELSVIKQNLEKTELENAETKDFLHRANIEMAELGIQICTLSSEKNDGEQKLAEVSHQLQQLKEQLAAEREKLSLDASGLKLEKESLQQAMKQSDELAAANQDLQKRLKKAEKHAERIQETSKEELSAAKFQMSTEIMNYQTQLKTVNEEMGNMKRQLQEQNTQISALLDQVAELQTSNAALIKQLDQKYEQVADCEVTINTKDEEVKRLTEELERTQEKVEKAENLVKEYHAKFDKAVVDKDKEKMKLLADLDDLNRTKINLEERLIELIRDKDALWQKSDALEFEQKVRAEERWLGDKEVNRCLECKSMFTWWLRKHHCRLCGRIFCYYCSNHFVMTKHSGKRERCCRTCLSEHSAVVQRFSESGSSSANSPDQSPSLETQRVPRINSVTVTDEVPKPSLVGNEVSKPDDATFDIITDEELSEVKDGDSSSQTEGQPCDNQSEFQDLFAAEQSVTPNLATPENTEEIGPVVQDAEICLLKSGELSLRVPLTTEEIFEFGEDKRELLIKSSSYSVIPVMVTETGLTINWVFSSDPKSVSFSVVYQESAESPLEQSKVLIPLTRCNSHKETIQGQLKARNTGIYLLIFDNTFSRFISKTVSYHLTVERPVIYDGSDFP